jgi:PTS system cellobiose-specific IIB component
MNSMAETTIMLVCAAGMSTSLLVSKMEKAAEEKGIDSEIFATSANEADTKLQNKDIDVLLLGPQVRFMKSQFEQKVEGMNIPVDVINMQDYGMVNGEKVLQAAMDLLEE